MLSAPAVPPPRPLTVMQLLPALESGGVERGTLEIAEALIAAGHRALVVSGGGRLVAELEALGAEHVTLPIGRKSLLSLRYIPVLRRLLQENQVDVLHLRSRLPAWLGYLTWRSLPAGQRPHLVTTVHGAYSVNRYSAIMLRGERVIAVSDTIVEYIHQNYPPIDPARIVRIHRGVDPARFPHGYQPDPAWLAAWQAQYPQLQGAWVLTLPGRITRWKGQLDFLRIVAALRQQGIPVQGLIVGGVEPRRQGFAQEIEQEIAALGLQACITLTGQRSDLKQIMAISAVVLSLSTDPEAFGRVSLEALSLGRPVLAYAHGGVGEQMAAIYPAGAVAVGDVAASVARLAEWYAGGAPPVPTAQPFTLAAMQAQTLAVYEALAGAAQEA
ncbi:glycosyltransferase family 4 protein [Halothiobacillus sp. DCM-1]|uniref:glycosyltransferase family 4 protein n=1 Tax=Halothiobacillus sp. DCM-1 TaxID=3112558 RepID=UPI00324721E7